MIYVEVIFVAKDGKRTHEEKSFDDCRKALRFMFAMKRKGNIIDSYRCDYRDDFEYLWERWHD